MTRKTGQGLEPFELEFIKRCFFQNVRVLDVAEEMCVHKITVREHYAALRLQYPGVCPLRPDKPLTIPAIASAKSMEPSGFISRIPLSRLMAGRA